MFKCLLCCGGEFSTNNEYIEHIENVLKQLNYCSNCSKNFNKASEFIQHLENNECQTTSASKAEQIINSDEEGPIATEEEYFCQICNISFGDVEEHLKTFHPSEKAIVLEGTKVEDVLESKASATVAQVTPKMNIINEQDCKDKDGRVYRRKFVKIDKFWLKNNTNITNEHSKSTVVNNENDNNVKEFMLTENLTIIQPAAKLNEMPTLIYMCNICNTEFNSFKSVRLHKRMHEKHTDLSKKPIKKETDPTENQCICKICNKKFLNKEYLEMHKKAHNNNKKFICSYCKKSFISISALDEHLLNQCHKREYECKYCGRRFLRANEKVKHERIHTGEKPHICNICGKAFRIYYCLTIHLRTHSDTRPYQCKHCLKKFRSLSVYNHHVQTHSEIRKYKCTFCPKAFKTSVQLAGHKNSHTKPFNCTICNRPFASLYAVRLHMDTHKKDNNLKYKCNICGALYSRVFALKDHLKQRHNGSDGSVNEVEETFVVEDDGSILLKDSNVVLNLPIEECELVKVETEMDVS